MLRRSDATGDATAAAAQTAYYNAVDAARVQAADRVMDRVRETGRQAADKAQGFYVETFNLDATVRRMRDVQADLLKSNAKKSADYELWDDGQRVASGSSKSYRDGQAAVNAQKGYGDQERLISHGQLDEAHHYIDQQTPKDLAKGRPNRTENAEELQSIKQKLTDRIRHTKDGTTAESEPLTRGDAEDRLNRARRGERPEFDARFDATPAAVAQEALRAGAVAFGATVGSALATSVVREIYARVKTGEIEPGVAKRLFEGTLDTAGEAALRAAVATGITHAARVGWFGAGAAAHVDPSLVGTLVYLTFEGIKDYRRYASGEIAGDTFADGMMQKSVVAVASAKGAVTGQLLIPVPLLGAAVGAAVGGFVASTGYAGLDVAVEAFFRSDDLEALAQTYGLLVSQWNSLLTDYDEWTARSSFYVAKRNRLLLLHVGRADAHAKADRTLLRPFSDDAL